jgi:hypothetical protein
MDNIEKFLEAISDLIKNFLFNDLSYKSYSSLLATNIFIYFPFI